MTTPAPSDDPFDHLPVARLSDRQLLERLVRATERIEYQMTVDEDYLKAAMGSLDVQFDLLRQRVDAQGQALKDAIVNATDYESLRTAVNQVADRIQADAVAMTTMAQPSVVADPQTPGDANTNIPTDPNTPIPPADSTQGDGAPTDAPVEAPADGPVNSTPADAPGTAGDNAPTA